MLQRASDENSDKLRLHVETGAKFSMRCNFWTDNMLRALSLQLGKVPCANQGIVQLGGRGYRAEKTRPPPLSGSGDLTVDEKPIHGVSLNGPFSAITSAEISVLMFSYFSPSPSGSYAPVSPV